MNDNHDENHRQQLQQFQRKLSELALEARKMSARWMSPASIPPTAGSRFLCRGLPPVVDIPGFPGANEPCLVVKRPMNSGLHGEIGLGHYRCQLIVTQVDGALERVGIIGA